jgi:hypothetical protein
MGGIKSVECNSLAYEFHLPPILESLYTAPQPSNEVSVVITRSVSFHLPPILESLYTAPQPSNEVSVVITNETERVHHINYLELLAVFHAIESFCKNHKNTYVGLRIDNTCAIAYLNNMGGIKSVECNSLATPIWLPR